jgi:hypothetical protein
MQVREYGALLLSQGVRNRHDAFSVPLAAIALRAEADFSPLHEGAKVSFGKIVRWLDVLAVDCWRARRSAEI